MVWQDFADIDNSGTDPDIWYKWLNTTTDTWSNWILVTDEGATTGWSGYPAIAIDNNNDICYVLYIEVVYVCVYEDREKNKIIILTCALPCVK